MKTGSVTIERHGADLRGAFCVRAMVGGVEREAWFGAIEDALVDASLELRERGILVSREGSPTVIEDSFLIPLTERRAASRDELPTLDELRPETRERLDRLVAIANRHGNPISVDELLAALLERARAR